VAACHVGDLGIGERADELAQRVRRPLGRGVGEGEDVRVRLADRPILRGDLPAALAPQQANAGLARGNLLDDLVRAVGRSI